MAGMRGPFLLTYLGLTDMRAACHLKWSQKHFIYVDSQEIIMVREEGHLI